LPDSRTRTLLLFLEILAVSSFAWHKLVFEPWTAPQGLSFLILAGILAVLGIGLSRIFKIYVGFLASRTEENEQDLRRFVLLTLSPFLLLYLVFLQDFIFINDIDQVIFGAAGLAFIYLHIVFLAQLKNAHPQAILVGKIWGQVTLKGLDPKRFTRRLFFITLAVYVLYLSGLVVPAQPFTGDEPHYLLVTKSLVSDGDINLYNNYQNKDYLKFYPGELDYHAYEGKNGERFLYSKHFPGLPVLLVPSYFLGEKISRLVFRITGDAGRGRQILVFFSRLPICFLAAFLSSAFFLFVWGMTKKRKVAALSWFVFSFTTPFLFYSHLIYPEIPVALILLLICYQILLKKNLSNSSLLGAGLGIGLLPWFGLKYIILAAALFLGIVFLSLKPAGINLKRMYAFFGPPILSAAVFVFSLFFMYGTISPQAVYRGTAAAGGLPLSSFIVSDFLSILRRLLGIFFDQRVGIFVYAPVYVLCLAGLFLFAKRIKKEALFLFGLFLVFWVFCSFTYYWGGYCPPGRPLLPVLWILALFMAGAFAYSRGRTSLVIRGILVAVSSLIAFVFLRNPRLLYHESLSSLGLYSPRELFSNFLTRYNNLFVDWRKLVPSLSNTLPESLNWAPLIVWIPMVLGITALLLRSKGSRTRQSRPISLSAHLGCVAAFTLFLTANALFNFRLVNGFTFEGKDYEVFSQDENSFGKEMDGFWVKGRRKASLIIKTMRPVSEIRLTLSSPTEGETAVRLSRFSDRAQRNSRGGFEKTLTFLSPPGLSWRASHLYRLQINESNGFYPREFDKNSDDQRFLGVFIKIGATFLPPDNQ